MKVIKGDIKNKKKRETRGRKCTYPFDTIKKGQAMKLSKKDILKKQSIINSAYQYAARNGIKFKVVTDGKEVTIHRVE